MERGEKPGMPLPFDQVGDAESDPPIDAAPSTPAGASEILNGRHRRERFRLATPLSDFVSALRLAIAAFGQGEVGGVSELTPRQIADVMPFIQAPLARTDAAVTRILYLGELVPYSGVVDLLSCAIEWSERNPAKRVDICWAGYGDLQGVLRAQLTPPNLTQSFTPLPTGSALVELMGRCGILAVPNLGQADLLALALGMAAGLPVLGNLRSPQVRLLVSHAVNGWLFDPVSLSSMFDALGAALTTPAPEFDRMRVAARARIDALCAERPDGQDLPAARCAPARLATSGQA